MDYGIKFESEDLMERFHHVDPSVLGRELMEHDTAVRLNRINETIYLEIYFKDELILRMDLFTRVVSRIKMAPKMCEDIIRAYKYDFTKTGPGLVVKGN